MRNFLTIWGRELSACFLSPVAYVVVIVFLLVTYIELVTMRRDSIFLAVAPANSLLYLQGTS